MTLFKNIAIISGAIGIILYLFQILMIIGCCDKHINFQINVFKATVIAMSIAFISLCVTLITK